MLVVVVEGSLYIKRQRSVQYRESIPQNGNLVDFCFITSVRVTDFGDRGSGIRDPSGKIFRKRKLSVRGVERRRICKLSTVDSNYE